MIRLRGLALLELMLAMILMVGVCYLVMQFSCNIANNHRDQALGEDLAVLISAKLEDNSQACAEMAENLSARGYTVTGC